MPLDSTPLWYQLRPEEFQRRLHDIVCGMEGESLTDAQFWILWNVSQHSLKLTPAKIKFKSYAAPFMGHVLSPERLKTSPEITNAVLNKP